MPFGGGRTQAVNVSGLLWDADLVVPAAFRILVNHLGEYTGGHSVVFDNILTRVGIIAVDHLGEATGGHGVVVNQVLHADHIGEDTGAHGVVVNQVLHADHIGEDTGAHGTELDQPGPILKGQMMTLGGGV